MKLIIPTEGKKKHYTKAFLDTRVRESLSTIIARRKNARKNARLVNIITK